MASRIQGRPIAHAMVAYPNAGTKDGANEKSIFEDGGPQWRHLWQRMQMPDGDGKISSWKRLVATTSLPAVQCGEDGKSGETCRSVAYTTFHQPLSDPPLENFDLLRPSSRH